MSQVGTQTHSLTHTTSKTDRRKGRRNVGGDWWHRDMEGMPWHADLGIVAKTTPPADHFQINNVTDNTCLSVCLTSLSVYVPDRT